MVTRLTFWKITALLLLGLFIFFYILINSTAEFYFAITNPAAGLHFHFEQEKDAVVIYEVLQRGPATLTGLQSGDLILAVNDLRVTSEWNFVRALLQLDSGTAAEIQAVRDGREITLTFVPGTLVDAKVMFLSLLPGVIFGYLLCLIAVFVLLKRVQDREAQLFYLMLIFWALAMRETFPNGFMLHNLLPFWFRDLLLLPAWPLAVGMFLHFSVVFPVENRVCKEYRRPVIALIYAPLLLIIPHTYAYAKDLDWVQYDLRYGWGVWLSLYFFAAFFFLFHSYKNAPTVHVKKQTTIILHGTVLSLGVPFLFYFLPKLLFGDSLPYAEFTTPLIVLWPFALAYTIVKHRFMNIDVIVKRGVAYALISGFVVAAYFLLVVGIGRLALYFTGSRSQLVAILATLFIAALFNPVKNKIQNFVEHRFYPSRFTYREAIRTFGHELVTVLDLEKLLERLSVFLMHSMKIRPVAIFWYDGAADLFKVRKIDGLGFIELPVFAPQDTVVRQLRSKLQLVDLSPLRDQTGGLGAEESDKWRLLQAEMVLPLLAKGALMGFVTVGPKQGDEPYFNEDIELLQSLNDRVNVSLANALLTEELREQDRLKKELEVARRIQLSSLPATDPNVPGLDVCGISLPALEVGGDYYDYLELRDGRFGVVVGDVSGKGTSAALYMSQLKGIINTASRYHRSLKELLTEVNHIAFRSLEPKSFITLAYGAFDLTRKKLSLVRAGHLPLLYYDAEKERCRQVVPKGIGVGLDNGKVFEAQIHETELTLKSGDVCLFFTDGVVEAHNRQGDEFECEPLQELLEENGCLTASELRDTIISEVRQFSDHVPQHDDMTLVVVKVK
ncbi:MAG: SpoIIE family protein phosphatase [bacterium]